MAFIEFGKCVPRSGARGLKPPSLEPQRPFMRENSLTIAPEIVSGIKRQNTTCDVFSLTKIERIFKKAELGRLPLVLVQALNIDPTKRQGGNFTLLFIPDPDQFSLFSYQGNK